MRTGRIVVATLGVGAALTVGAWTLSAAAVPLPADPISIPMIGTSEAAVADARTSPASDAARAVADAEARLQAINSQLQTLVAQQAPVSAASSATAAPTTAAPTTAAVITPGQAPPTHTVTGASGSASADEDEADGKGHEAEEHDADEQDD